MQVFSLERPNCTSVRPRRSESALIEEQQNEAKLYRSLLSLFADNLNATLRSHRDCLGDIDYYPRIKISRQEQLALQDCLEKVMVKQEDKLSKDSLARNAFIKRSVEEYLRIYRTAFPESALEHSDSRLFEAADFEQFRFRKTLSGKKFSCPTPVPSKRPLSSKAMGKGKGLAGITQAFQLFQASTAAQTYKLKTISAQLTENPQNKRDKGFILTNRSKQDSPTKKAYSSQKKVQQVLQLNSEEDVNFTGSEIVINERKARYAQEDQRENQRGPVTPYAKLGNKRMVNLKFPQRKSIEEIEKMQIQNRIMMVNSVLSVNLAPPQPLGYRPKSRCWQNYFN